MKLKWLSRFLKTAIMICTLAGEAFAGAWSQEQGNSYNRLALSYFVTDKEYNDAGDSQPIGNNGEFKDFKLHYYGEYGVWNTLTIFGSFYYVSMEQDDDLTNHKTNGFGDLDVGLRYQFYTGKLGVVSLQGLIKIPELYDDSLDMPLGNGQYDYELRFLYGLSLYPVIPGYINLETGYRWRDEEPADEYRYLVEIGFDLGKSIYSRAKFDLTESVGNSEYSMDAHSNLGYNLTNTMEYKLAKLDLTMGFKFNSSWGVELSYIPTLWGNNTKKGAAWSLAISMQPNR